MTGDFRTALDELEFDKEIIRKFIIRKNMKLMRETIHRCTMERPCIKCRCLYCGRELPITGETLDVSLHDECYHKVLEENR